MEKQIFIFLLIVVVSLIVMIIILFLFLVQKGLLEKKSLIKMTEFKENWSEAFRLFFIEGTPLPESFSLKTKNDYIVTEEILLQYTKHVKGELFEQNISLFANHYFAEKYTVELNSKKMSSRAGTLSLVLLFKMESLLSVVREMIESNQKYTIEETVLMYRVLSSLSSSEILPRLKENKIVLNEYDYKKIMAEWELDTYRAAFHQFDEFPTEFRYALIRMAGIMKIVELTPLLEELLQGEDNEIRIRAMQTISKIEYVRDITQYTRFAQSPYWEERLMLAKVLNHFDNTESQTILHNMLSDKNWWVRSAAAKSILESSAEGAAALEEIIKTSDDLFARDAAEEALERNY